MVRISLKNTFLELEVEANEDDNHGGSPTFSTLSQSLRGSPQNRRARSVDCSPSSAVPTLQNRETVEQIDALNRLLATPMSSPHGQEALGKEQKGSLVAVQRSSSGVSLSSTTVLSEDSRSSESENGKTLQHGDDDDSSGFSEHSSSADIELAAQGAAAIDDVEAASLAKSRNGQKVKDYHHKHVPRNHDLQANFARREGPHNITTVMLRNIPNRLCQVELIAELEDLGFSGTFDFVYIPMDNGRKHRGSSRSSMSNVGYAFVNFVCASWAERCTAVFQDHSFPGSSRVTRVSPAHVQGLEANMAHFASSAVNSQKLQQRRPVVMASLSHTCGFLPPAPR
jgi:hypothetical protein